MWCDDIRPHVERAREKKSVSHGFRVTLKHIYTVGPMAIYKSLYCSRSIIPRDALDLLITMLRKSITTYLYTTRGERQLQCLMITATRNNSRPAAPALAAAHCSNSFKNLASLLPPDDAFGIHQPNYAYISIASAAQPEAASYGEQCYASRVGLGREEQSNASPMLPFFLNSGLLGLHVCICRVSCHIIGRFSLQLLDLRTRKLEQVPHVSLFSSTEKATDEKRLLQHILSSDDAHNDDDDALFFSSAACS